MYCKFCGVKNVGKVRFCKDCGHEIVKVYSFDFNPIPWIGRHKKGLMILFILMAVFIVGFSLLFQYNQEDNQRSQISSSVVNILCDNEGGGSGIMFSSDGYVVTNDHVISGSKVCFVTIPNISSGAPEEVYLAEPIIIPSLSEEYDIAMLEIYKAYEDSAGKMWGEYPRAFTPYQFPDNCIGQGPKLGDSVRIYGYPVTSGGLNLTITDGIVSSFSEDGEILTSAKIDSGNSGGLAVDKDGCMLGIPSAVFTGVYENLGVIIPNSAIVEFSNNIPEE